MRQRTLTNSGRNSTEASTTTAQAREFAENLRALIHPNAPLLHVGNALSWWFDTTHNASSNMEHYVDDIVLINTDEDVVARLERLALLVGALPHWV